MEQTCTPEPDPTNDPLASAMLRARAGDGDAQDLVCREVLQIAHAWYGREHLDSPRTWEDAVDLAQSVALRFLTRLDRFRYEGRGAFIRYVQRNAAHLWQDRFRQVNRQRNREDSIARRDLLEREAPPRTPSSIVHARQLLSCYEESLAGLDEADQKLIRRVGEEGESWESIAAELGIQNDAARQRYARARIRLGRRMRVRGKGLES